MSRPSTSSGASPVWRSAVCSAGRRSDWLTFSPAKSAAIQPGRPGRARVGDEQRQRVPAEPLLRQVDEPVVPGERQAREAVGVAREELGERDAGECSPVGGEIEGDGGSHRVLAGRRGGNGVGASLPCSIVEGARNARPSRRCCRGDRRVAAQPPTGAGLVAGRRECVPA